MAENQRYVEQNGAIEKEEKINKLWSENATGGKEIERKNSAKTPRRRERSCDE